MPARVSREQRTKFLGGRHVAVLVTNGADGVPVPGPIWYLYRDGAFYFRTAADARRTKNIERDPRVSVCVQDERAPYRAVIAYGRAKVEAPAQWLADEMPKRYLGFFGAIGYRAAQDSIMSGPEVTLVATPERYASFDFSAETPWFGRAWLVAKRVLPPWL